MAAAGAYASYEQVSDELVEKLKKYLDAGSQGVLFTQFGAKNRDNSVNPNGHREREQAVSRNGHSRIDADNKGIFYISPFNVRYPGSREFEIDAKAEMTYEPLSQSFALKNIELDHGEVMWKMGYSVLPLAVSQKLKNRVSYPLSWWGEKAVEATLKPAMDFAKEKLKENFEESIDKMRRESVAYKV